MEVDVLKPGTAPLSEETVLWFEFLLKPSLLDLHLKKVKPGKCFNLCFNVLTKAHEMYFRSIPN